MSARNTTRLTKSWGYVVPGDVEGLDPCGAGVQPAAAVVAGQAGHDDADARECNQDRADPRWPARHRAGQAGSERHRAGAEQQKPVIMIHACRASSAASSLM